MTAPHQTLDQRRAAHAWNAVAAFGQHAEPAAHRKAFSREAKRLPMRIHTAGLGHALLFLKAKQQGKPGEPVLEAVCGWLVRDGGPLGGSGAAGVDAFGRTRDALLAGSSRTLSRATGEALAYLQWLSRFAEAEFGPGLEE